MSKFMTAAVFVPFLLCAPIAEAADVQVVSTTTGSVVTYANGRNQTLTHQTGSSYRSFSHREEGGHRIHRHHVHRQHYGQQHYGWYRGRHEGWRVSHHYGVNHHQPIYAGRPHSQIASGSSPKSYGSRR
jgi:hypothetical protein